MIGFALEGGGAKGAYEVGAYIALRKCGIKPNIIAGTSIGSLNAALMAQGDTKKLIDLWTTTTTDIFGIDSNIINKIKNKKISLNDIKLGYENIKEIINNKGIDTTEFLKILEENIDEKKLRKSKIKFGLVTVKLKGMEPLELTIDDIPEGKVAEYILASCYLPIFSKKAIIDNNYYIDGGFYNNLPLSLVEHYGCDTIYSIRIKGIGINNNKLLSTTKVIEICPKEDLGSLIIFDKESNERNLKLGYYDTLKIIKNLDGNKYYFKNKNNIYYNRIIKRINYEDINYLRLKYNTFNNKKLIIKIVEEVLEQNNIKRFDIKNIKKELKKIKNNYIIKDKHIQSFINSCKL